MKINYRKLLQKIRFCGEENKFFIPVTIKGPARSAENGEPAERRLFCIAGAIATAVQLPPLDSEGVLARCFKWSVETLASTDPLVFQTLIKLNLTAGLIAAIGLWLWSEGWRERFFQIPAAVIAGFLGMAIPVRWLVVTIPTVKAFIVIALGIGLVAFSFILPFVFIQELDKQRLPRRILLGVFAAIILIQALLRYGH